MKRRFLYMLLVFLAGVSGQTVEFVFSIEITAPTLEALKQTVNMSSIIARPVGQTETGPTVTAEIKCFDPYFFNGTGCQRCSVCKRPAIIIAQLCTASTDTICDTHCLSGAALMGGLCTMCPPGKYATSAECVACAVGSYSRAVGASVCVPCADNKSSGSGFTACVQVKKPSAKMALLYLCSQKLALRTVLLYIAHTKPLSIQNNNTHDQIVYFTIFV
jgi:hypothetical protein